MRFHKGALHVHTRLSDGLLTPFEMIEVYRGLGYDFVAFTDHDYLVGNNARYFSALPDGERDFLVFKGVEVEWAEIGYHHISKIWGDRELLVVLNHPEQYGISVMEVIRRVGVVGKTIRVDAIEITHKGRYSPLYDNDLIPLPKIATDDAHHPEDCGKAWIEVESAFDKDGIIRAIKNGDFRVGFKDSPPMSFKRNY